MENELLRKYNTILVEKNKVTNLTAHKTEEQSWVYNIKDSLLFADYIKNAAGHKMLDLGSGGGCPAIPMKIICPNLNVTMIDSVGKKTDFLNQTCAELGLYSIIAVHTRIEDFADANRESFDIVTARAVAELPTLLEYALPFLRVGGLFLAFKGRNLSEEIEKSKTALYELGGEIIEVKEALLCCDESGDVKRTLAVIKKIRPTPKKYPRAKNLPRIKPL